MQALAPRCKYIFTVNDRAIECGLFESEHMPTWKHKFTFVSPIDQLQADRQEMLTMLEEIANANGTGDIYIDTYDVSGNDVRKLVKKMGGKLSPESEKLIV